ncbi:YbbR-like domain-containing protein [Aquimarina sp. AD10]|uniref:CdaR family protein n=1 Tax=Aquimarina sp. AD10 TaxID=1714849 RepID=UPI000E50C2E7|nr:YbbR-like domain-containing protein [Aquimarina sp. AD10]AXT63507.1 YbbR-like domain-containing protein [Aquimarina sp. AD10]RKM99775.1 YbbR-like domain-containing protein [Aquimarina sp. AD10]
MSNRKKKIFSFKRNSVKTFLFFLIFTSALWLLIQFSKNYTKEVEIAIRYTNLPEDKIFNEESDQIVRMTLNGNGFRLMNHSWKKPILEFNIDDASSMINDQYYFRLDKGSRILKNKLDFKGNILALQKDSLRLKLDINLQKKVPVQLVQDVKYSVGYGSDKGLVIQPDSIVISGPSKIIDTIKSVNTASLQLEGLNVDYVDELTIDLESLPEIIKIKPHKVTATIEVSKFTEGNQKIPITVKNVPEDTEIKIFPKEVMVVYRVGLDKYNEISPRDFMVVADYAKSGESSFLTLELFDKPESIHDVRLREKQIQFVVLK